MKATLKLIIHTEDKIERDYVSKKVNEIMDSAISFDEKTEKMSDYLESIESELTARKLKVIVK